MKKIALIGKPIGHSLSPLLFRLAYSKLSIEQLLSSTDNTPIEIDGEVFDYQIVEENSAKLSIQTLLNNRFIAANVTAPYKTEIMQYVTDCDEVTKRLNATNLLLINDKEVKAYNTDYIAAKNIAQRILQNISDIDRVKVLFYVIGTGGAGKASIKAIVDLIHSKSYIPNCEIVATNRTAKSALEFIEQFDNVRFIPFDKIAEELNVKKESSNFQKNSAATIKIIFYTLPIRNELYHNIIANIAEELILIEPNYRIPQNKKLPKNLYIGGTEWLIEQAIYGFELFTGKKPNVEKMQQVADLIK